MYLAEEDSKHHHRFVDLRFRGRESSSIVLIFEVSHLLVLKKVIVSESVIILFSVVFDLRGTRFEAEASRCELNCGLKGGNAAESH